MLADAQNIQYVDTFRLQDQSLVVSDDALMWALLERQGEELHQRDSLERDSITRDLQFRDSLLTMAIAELIANRQIIRDSLAVLLPPVETTIDSMALVDAEIDSTRMAMDSLAYFLAHENHLPSATIQRSIIKDVQADLEDIQSALHQRKYWSRELDGLAHFSQNYISPNWYKGGVSTFSVLVQLKGFYNYNKDNISWENQLEWKTGATTTGKTDSLRRINVTDDLFRVRSQFGYQVVKKLYASLSVELNTTLWPTWNANKPTIKTSFMTPTKFYINGGVEYKPLEGLRVNFSPTVYRLIYAYLGEDIDRVDASAYGLEKGQKLKNEFGSSVRLNWNWKPIREVALETEFYFYTNYHSVEIDWEVACDFIINRFLTTRITLHPRYDSNYVAEGDSRAKLQFKELLSIGFAHKFR